MLVYFFSSKRSHEYHWEAVVAKQVLVAQSYLTLCGPVDCNHQAPLSIVFSQNSYVEALFPSVTIVGHRAYGEVIVK